LQPQGMQQHFIGSGNGTSDNCGLQPPEEEPPDEELPDEDDEPKSGMTVPSRK